MRDLKALQDELEHCEKELRYLRKKYPLIKKDRFVPRPKDIEDEFEYLRIRIKNLKININQLKMRLMNK